ncbi:hypothetical protein Hdeb2414_s0002g00056331 [Helianthus debilis subsp. tardiflorus]
MHKLHGIAAIPVASPPMKLAIYSHRKGVRSDYNPFFNCVINFHEFCDFLI